MDEIKLAIVFWCGIGACAVIYMLIAADKFFENYRAGQEDDEV